MTLRFVIDRDTKLADLPELVKVAEAAQWMSCSAGVLYAEIQRGALAAVKIGRLLRISRDELSRYIAKDRQGAA